MEKVLILSCSTGQGHNSCAQAIKEYFESQGVRCDFRDSFDFISKQFARFMSWGHSFIYRYLPGLFRWGYGYSNSHPSVFHKKSGIYKLLTAGAERLYQYLSDGQFDTVICTHVFSAIMLTHTLKKHPLPIQTAFVATDYTCHPGMDTVDLQKYFIPNDQLTDDFASYGIPRDRITATGIPIRQEFLTQVDETEARVRLNIGGGSRHLVMMCGSMGCGPMSRMIKHIAPILPKDAEVSVICGTNKRLYVKLKHRYGANPKIHIIGYTDQVPLYMDSADLYLTKPGGISITEAAAKKLPMAFVNAVAGCEQYNMNFFIDMGAAITAESPQLLAIRSVRLLCSTAKRQPMERALWGYRRQDGAKNIFDALSKEVCVCKEEIS